MREYKQKARFEAKARCLVEVSDGKFLAKASLSDLKSILPEGAEHRIDLLPIAGNACVINLGNANGDMMDTEVGLEVFKHFSHKPINLEHDRGAIVGHITNAALTEFNSNFALGSGSTILDASSLTDSLEPFNIAIGGYVYKSLFNEVAKKISESNNPNSPHWLSVAFSWEVAFDEHRFFVGSNERGGEGEIISDPVKLEAWGSYLKNNGGSGKTPDGRPLYRLISWARREDNSIDMDSVLAMGVALTLAPAGQVAGVVTLDTPETSESKASLEEIQAKIENTTENISQTSVANVTTNTTKTMKVLKDLNDLKSINDETAKEYSFANIANVVDASFQKAIEAAITEKAQEYQAKVTEKEQAAASAQKTADEAIAKVGQLEVALKAANEGLQKLEVAQQQAAATQKFNDRMAHFDEKFELNDTDRKAIASRITGLDDEAFAKIATDEISVFLAPKNKEEIAKASAAASTTTDEDAKRVAAEALAKTQSAQASLPNTTSSSDSLKGKYDKAFKLGEGITFQTKK